MRKVLFSLIDLVFLAIFNIAFFMIVGVTAITSIWLAYGFIHFSYIILILTPFIVKMQTKKSEAELFGISISTISFIYFLVTLILNAILIFGGIIAFLPTLLSNIIITGIYVILFISSVLTAETVSKKTKLQKTEINNIKNMSSALVELISKTDNKEVKKELNKAYDIISSSPTKSNPAAADLENEIKNIINKIDHALFSKQNDEAIALSRTIIILVQRRNNILKSKAN